MLQNELINNILTVGGIACLFFTVLLLIAAGTGIFDAVRDEEGKFKRPFSWKALLGLVLFLGGISSLLFWGNIRLINHSKEAINLMSLWLNAFGIFMIMHLFDLIIIDYLVVVKWHPKFLNLPDTLYYNSMRPHLEGFLRGIPFGMVVCFIVSLINYLM